MQPLPSAARHAALPDRFIAQSASTPESGSEENKKSEEGSRLFRFAKESFKTGLTVGASILGGFFGGAPGAVAAGAAASGAVNLADQLIGRSKKERESGIDWGSVLLDMTLGVLPGGVGAIAVRTGEKALANLTGKAIATQTGKPLLKRVILEAAVDGAAMGYVGSALQSGYANYKEEGKLNFARAHQEGMRGILSGAAGGAIAGGLFTALRRELHRGGETQAYEAAHAPTLAKLREQIGDPGLEPIRLTWRQRTASALFERSEDDMIRNLHTVDERLIRGAMPESAGALYKLKEAHGVRTIIDLRGEGGERMEKARRFEQKWAAELGMRYVHIPMSAKQAPGEYYLREFLKAVDQSQGKVYVHCQQGIDRTGIMVAAYELAHGRKGQVEAFQEMKKHGYNWIHEYQYPEQRALALNPNFQEQARKARIYAQADGLPDEVVASIYAHLNDNRLDEAEKLLNATRNPNQPRFTANG